MQRHMRCALTGLVILAAAAGQSGVLGHITVDGATINPTQAVAVRTVAGWDKAEVIRVYLSPTALDPSSVLDALDPENALEAQIPGDFSVVTLTPDGSLAGVYAFFAEGAKNVATYHGELENVTLDDRHAAGRVFTRQPEKIAHTVMSFDLTFTADLLPVRRPTSTLPADGGAPGAAYLGYVRGWQEGDRALLMAHGEAMQAAAYAEMDEETLAYMLSAARETAHKEANVTGGAMYGDYAILTVNGRDWVGDAFQGRVKMVKDGTSWRIEEEKLEPVY